MKKMPDAMIIVDPKKEINAIREARKLNIPVFGIVDTNCDPDLVDYVIPANDDAVRSIKVVLGVLNNAICEATNKELVDYVTEDDKVNMADVVEDIKVVEKEDKVEAKEEKKPAKKETKKEVVKEEKVEEKKETKKTTKKVEKKEEVKEEKKTTKKATTKKEEKVDLSKLTVAELKEMAKAKGIEGYTKLKKVELIDALK